MKALKIIILITAFAITAILAKSAIAQTSLAQCLADRGFVMYGTEWCPNCEKQKELFGPSFSYIPYIDCDQQSDLCRQKNIRGYPVWEDASGRQYPGAYYLDQLAQMSNCPAAPTPPDLPDSPITPISPIFPYLLTAFLAGLLSFFAPCVLPLIPSYLSSITGFTFSDLYGLSSIKFRLRLLLSSMFFISGFAIIFSLLGAAASAIGQFINNNVASLVRVSGGILIILGLIQTGILKFDRLRFDFAWNVQRRLGRLEYLAAVSAGIVSALIWIPCIGPILGSTLVLASSAGSTQKGFLLLLIYSLGIGTPFILISLAFPRFFNLFQKNKKLLHTISILSGLIMLAFGALLALNKYSSFLFFFNL